MSSKQPIFRRQTWLSRLNIAQKIGYGYSITIGIFVFGTSLGLILGDYYQTQAEKKLFIAQEQKELLVKLENAVLKVRAHPQEFLTIVEGELRFSYERTQFRGYVTEVQELLNQLDDFIHTHHQQLGMNETIIQNLQDQYEKTSFEYIQLIESIIAKIVPSNSHSVDKLTTQEQFLAVMGGKQADRLQFEFERLSEGLTRTIREADIVQDEAIREFERSEIIRIQIVIVSMILSVIMAALLAIRTTRDISTPLKAVADIAKQVTQKSNFDLQAPVTTEDDIGSLAVSLNQLIQWVGEYTRELSQSQKRLSAILEALPVGVAVHDPDGSVSYMNETGQNIVGKGAVPNAPTEALAETYQAYIAGTDELYPPQKLPIFHGLQGTVLMVDDMEIDQNGYRIPLEVKGSPIFDEAGNIVLGISVFQNIKHRKDAEKFRAEYSRRLEQQVAERTAELEKLLESLKASQNQLIQSEKMAGLGQMVAGVAHEINNPVSFIYGNIQPAKNYLDDLLSLLKLYQEKYPNSDPEILEKKEDIDFEFILDDFPKILNSMNEGAERIRDIVQSLKTFSRLDESGMKRIDIQSGIKSTLLLLQYRFQGRENYPEIKIIQDYTALPLVNCYPSQVNQVLMNILANACDALECLRQPGSEREPMIKITTKVVESNQVEILIEDNGEGMSKEVQAKIFDPFFTTKPVGAGTGLGLSVSYSIIVEKHQGHLSCQSTLNQGTTFTIRIPI